MREKFLGVPSYKDRVITEGSIFHIVTYGINSMGSHANQVDAHERWLIADYVLKLKSIIIVEQTDRNRYVYIFK
jgi:hypothetical protein